MLSIFRFVLFPLLRPECSSFLAELSLDRCVMLFRDSIRTKAITTEFFWTEMRRKKEIKGSDHLFTLEEKKKLYNLL